MKIRVAKMQQILQCMCWEVLFLMWNGRSRGTDEDLDILIDGETESGVHM